MRSLAIALLVACGDDRIPERPAEFPDLARLYAGDHGIYRGCGPNGNVCHNGNEFPNLATLGAIVDGIGAACNLKRDRADAVHDLCERPGDLVEILGDAPEQLELAHVVPASDGAFALTLRHAPASFAGDQPLAITRAGQLVARLGELATVVQAVDDPRVLLVTPSEPALAVQLARAGIPGEPDTLRVGDPNRNGVFGAELGGALIVPGAPERSYLLRRLTDPDAGPLMPRANCCFWTKPALRALWCWVAGLRDDNALAPIDYAACPPLPAVELAYPEPGPSCETAGECPVTGHSLEDE